MRTFGGNILRPIKSVEERKITRLSIAREELKKKKKRIRKRNKISRRSRKG